MTDMYTSHPNCLLGRTFWPAVEDVMHRQPPAASKVCISWKELLGLWSHLPQGSPYLETSWGPVIWEQIRSTTPALFTSSAQFHFSLCPILLPLVNIPHPKLCLWVCLQWTQPVTILCYNWEHGFGVMLPRSAFWPLLSGLSQMSHLMLCCLTS